MRITSRSLAIFGLLMILLVVYFYNLVPLVSSWGHSSNYENVSVRTTVNITQSYPEIISITCNNGTSITLNAGGNYTVLCAVNIRDFNGGGTINTTNGTFFYYLNNSGDPNDNNEHYTNVTCTENNTAGSYNATWICGFEVLYYANNGTWIANISVMDDYNLTDIDNTSATIDPLFALNVTDVIDFGDLPVGDTSATSVEANITNYGNMDINVSVFGYGGNDSVAGAGLAMICAIRNISLPNERYDLASATLYNAMTRITGATTHISGLQISQQTNDAQEEINSTYWRLHVNSTTNPYGICNGTVVFAAEAP